MNIGFIILLIIALVLILRSIICIAFQKSTYKAYKQSLETGKIDEAILKGRSYYLSLSNKNRKRMGITDVVQIDNRVKEDVSGRHHINIIDLDNMTTS